MAFAQLRDASLSPFAPRMAVRSPRAGIGAVGSLSRVSVIGIVMAIAWLPLLILAIVEGTAVGDAVRITFLIDYTPHGRYLLALPLLLLMDGVVDRRTALAVEQLRDSGLVAPADQQRFQRDLESVARAWRSRAIRWAFVILTYLGAYVSFLWARELDVSSWMTTAEAGAVRPSLAGAWNLLISAPLLRFLVLRALWKLAIWAWFLFRLSRLRMQIYPLHPDGRCGLRFLGQTQLAFTAMIAAFGVQLGCLVAVAVRFSAHELASFKLLGAAFIVLSLLLVLGPLVVFAHQAWLAKERAENAFSVWAGLAASHMSVHLFKDQREHLPGHLTTSEISTMCDASALFDRVVATWPIPVDLRQIAAVLGTAVVSALLPLLALLPLAEILKRLAGVLL